MQLKVPCPMCIHPSCRGPWRNPACSPIVHWFIICHVQVRKSTQIAGLYFLHCDTFRVGPKPTPLETADFPENVLFRRLDSRAPREKPVASLRPGVLLLAVYGDNWSAPPFALLGPGQLAMP